MSASRLSPHENRSRTLHPVVQEFTGLLSCQSALAQGLDAAIEQAQAWNVPALYDIRSRQDYINWINELLYWVPCENMPGHAIYNQLCKFHFILDQPALRSYQNPVLPREGSAALTPLSAWMVRYAQAMGAFLDTPESITDESLESFKKSPSYNMNDYIQPHGGWKSFNQFFARHAKPGYRPIAAPADAQIVVAPADATFAGQWEIRSSAGVTAKGLHWHVDELLADSPYRQRFKNGMFMHAFLGPNDYHRLHAPVSGTVLEARVIPGQVYLEVAAVPDSTQAAGHQLELRRHFSAPNSVGYQFSQARGLVVLDSPVGLVAVLPIGMCQVSSVILTAEEGVALRKGEELGYFQFGGSDVVVLFEARCNVCFTAQPDTHYRMGSKIAQAYPVY